jgi:S1-C subfamily serine protease
MNNCRLVKLKFAALRIGSRTCYNNNCHMRPWQILVDVFKNFCTEVREQIMKKLLMLLVVFAFLLTGCSEQAALTKAKVNTEATKAALTKTESDLAKVSTTQSANTQRPEVPSIERNTELQTTAIMATVRIRQNQGKEGSGVLIGREGSDVYILTAQHVVSDAKQVKVEIFTKDSYPKPKWDYDDAVVIKTQKAPEDLALLRVISADPLPAFLPPSRDQKFPKDAHIPVMSTGCDSGKAPISFLDNTVTKKQGKRPDGKIGIFWEMDANRHPGNSGGPLIDKDGCLIGICSGTNNDKTYFTHHETILTFLKGTTAAKFAKDKGSK